MPPDDPSVAAATMPRAMADDDAQRAADTLAWLEAVWRLDPVPPRPPRLPATLTVKALDVIGPPPSAAGARARAAVARARFELELPHAGDELDDADYALEIEEFEGLEDPNT